MSDLCCSICVFCVVVCVCVCVCVSVFAGCDDAVGPEGMEKFCEDIGVEPENVRNP